MALPTGFIDLDQAFGSAQGSLLDVIGIVVDVMPATLTRTGELMFTFKLLDRPLSNRVIGSDGLRIRFFAKAQNNLPRIQNIGDVVLLRRMRMLSRDGQPIGINGYSTGVLVFPAHGIPDLGFSIAYLDKQKLECYGVEQMRNSVTVGEQAYVMALKGEMKTRVDQKSEQAQRMDEQRIARATQTAGEPPAKRHKPDTAQQSTTFGKKFKLIKDLEPRTFADLCGKVVKSIPAGYGGNDLYITDYTPNELMRLYPAPEEEATGNFQDGDEYGYSGTSKKPWPGPFGQYVLKVNLKAPHAAYANRMLKEGDWVLLRNVKVRMTDILKLEGDMWPDDIDRERVKVQKLMNADIPEIQSILQREENYWTTRNAKLNKPPPGEAKLSKREKKRRNKLAREEQEKQTALDEDSNSNTSPLKKSKNPYIRCSHGEVALTRIKDILDPKHQKHTTSLPDGRVLPLPFINAKYRAKVRVIDFAPKALDDFSIPADPSSSSATADDSIDSMAWPYDNTPKYEWCFSLLLEDASSPSQANNPLTERLWVQVHHSEAQFLFGNSIRDPDDLRHDPQLLANVREKLFVLWGNLEEKDGDAELSNLPFECCIQEYGIETGEETPDDGADGSVLYGWRRMYSMFGTTIL